MAPEDGHGPIERLGTYSNAKDFAYVEGAGKGSEAAERSITPAKAALARRTGRGRPRLRRRQGLRRACRETRSCIASVGPLQRPYVPGRGAHRRPASTEGWELTIEVVMAQPQTTDRPYLVVVVRDGSTRFDAAARGRLTTPCGSPE